MKNEEVVAAGAKFERSMKFGMMSVVASALSFTLTLSDSGIDGFFDAPMVYVNLALFATMVFFAVRTAKLLSAFKACVQRRKVQAVDSST